MILNNKQSISIILMKTILIILIKTSLLNDMYFSRLGILLESLKSNRINSYPTKGGLKELKFNDLPIYQFLNKKSVHLRLGSWIINLVPVSVSKPHSICFHCISILISMPSIVSMGSVLDIKSGMPKAGLSESWVLWLWLCHTG